MSEIMDVWTTTAVVVSKIVRDTPAAAAVEMRADVLRMTQTAEDAVLKPRDPGGWSHAIRAALAVRIARLNACSELADHYLELSGANAFDVLSDPSSTKASEDLKPCLRFIDRVAARPREVTADDIRILQDAGVSDADIVRLTELNAFLGYQIRLIEGLALLKEVRA